MKLIKSSSFACVVVAVSFTFLVTLFAKQTSTDTIALLKNLFPASKISWEISFQGDIEKYKVTTSGIIVMTSNKTSKHLHYLSLEGERLWKLESEKVPFRDFQVSQDGKRVIVVDVLDNAQRTHISVFNNSGEKLFEIDNRGTLLSSPTGKYFYTAYNEGDPGSSLKIFNEMGEVLWTRTPEYALWYIIPLSDKELVLIEGNECIMYEATSGIELWRYTLGPEFMVGEGTGSPDGEYFVIYGGKSLYIFNKNDKLLWSKISNKYFSRATISKDRKYVATQCEKNGEVFVILFNNKNGEIIWERKFERISSSEIFQGLEDFTINDGILAAVGIFARSSDPERTLFLEFDQESGRLLREYVLPGEVEFLIGCGDEVTYYLNKSGSLLSKIVRGE